MTTGKPFFPHTLYAGDDANQQHVPRVFASPGRYIQGRGVLARVGSFLSIISSSHPAVMISHGGQKRFGDVLTASFNDNNIDGVFEIFDGECSYEEVERVVAALSAVKPPVDAVIGVGGGKCLDAAKCVAFRLRVPVVICPTIASTDAPCSAVSVMYSQHGEGLGPEFFPDSPAFVLVDSQIILNSPKRHLIAGMGDSLATCYEATMCYENPHARSMLGGRLTLAAVAIADLCAKIIYSNGSEAAAAIEKQVINEPLEKVIEANTLLSGIGFESGGLSIAHAVAVGLTVIPVLHQKYLHGELVGISTLIQLLMDDKKDEAIKAATFMVSVGLPIVLEQLSLNLKNDEKWLKDAMTAAVGSTLASSAPFEVTPEGLFAALQKAQQLGLSVIKQYGDAPYRQLHG